MRSTDRLPNTWYEHALVRLLQVDHDPMWVCVREDHEPGDDSPAVLASARAQLTDHERELASRLSLGVALARGLKKTKAVRELGAALSTNARWSEAVDDLLACGTRPEGLSPTETRLVEGAAFRRAMRPLANFRHDRSFLPFGG